MSIYPLAKAISDEVDPLVDKIDFAEIAGKTIVITGASGLIGQYLCAALDCAALRGIVPAEIHITTAKGLPDFFKDMVVNSNVTAHTGDLTDDAMIRNLPNADYIIHAAGYGQPGKFMVDPVKTIALNTSVTARLLNKLNNGGKFLFASTSEVYSGLLNPPFAENQIGTTNTDHARSCYIEGKRCGEAIVNAYRNIGVSAKSARVSLAYGPGTRPDDARVLNSFIRKALTDGEIRMLDDGTAWRTYLYITDAAEFLFNILFRGRQGIYNVGGKSRITIKGLAGEIGRQTGVKVFSPNTIAPVAGAPDDVYVSMERSETEFGKNDYVSLAEGLQRTIAWQRELYSPQVNNNAN